MNFVFRCDANPAAGLGHLARCLALAEALRHRHHFCRFLGQWGEDARRILNEAAFSFSDAVSDCGSREDIEPCAASARGSYLIGDGYGIQEDWLIAMHREGVPVALIDDFGALPSYGTCRAVINFTLGAAELEYPGLPPQRLAAGPGFFCVRDDLTVLRTKGLKKASPPRRILLTIGGSDRHGRTPLIYQALKKHRPELSVRILLSASDAKRFRFQTLPGELFHLPVEIAQHYAWADACICGGGLVKYECAFLDLPVAMFSQTPEQQADSDLFCSRGLGWDLAPRGNSDEWQIRLFEFLKGPPSSSGATIFPRNSSAAAAIHLETWMPRGTDE